MCRERERLAVGVGTTLGPNGKLLRRNRKDIIGKGEGGWDRDEDSQEIEIAPKPRGSLHFSTLTLLPFHRSPSFKNDLRTV